jgi:Glycosyl transferase family 2
MTADRLRVHLFCLCWNDARMLPFFFRHYDRFVDRYFVYDNGSTDQSIPILKKHRRVELSHFDVTGDSFIDEERRLGDTIWKGSDADWVIVTDIDEHIHHPEILEYLRRCKERGVTAIQTIGYEMISEVFPRDTPGREQRLLNDLVTVGARSEGHDRLCIFDPRAITETNFNPGRHKASPQGRVVWPKYSEILLLHFKQLGVDYAAVRSAELKQGLRPRDVEQGWGFQYSWSTAEIRANWENLKALSGPVPGLGSLKHVQPVDYCREERCIRLSGLLDQEWYLANYPDVESSGGDPLLHFCIHGWKEGRKPNFYFDPEWYCLNYPNLSEEGRNPLFDYVAQGEEADAWPSPYFNTPWYRQKHGLSRSDSPLRHYLLTRKSGNLTPIPGFDVAAYCQSHPEILAAGEDPFESYCLRSE